MYGENCFNDTSSTFKFDLRMKEQGKIAWTTFE